METHEIVLLMICRILMLVLTPTKQSGICPWRRLDSLPSKLGFQITQDVTNHVIMTTNRKLKLFVIVTSLISHDMNVKVTWHFFINQSQESHYHSWLEVEIQGNETISYFKPLLSAMPREMFIYQARTITEHDLFWWQGKRRYMYTCILKLQKARYTVLWLIQLEIWSSYCPSCKSILPFKFVSVPFHFLYSPWN